MPLNTPPLLQQRKSDIPDEDKSQKDPMKRIRDFDVKEQQWKEEKEEDQYPIPQIQGVVPGLRRFHLDSGFCGKNVYSHAYSQSNSYLDFLGNVDVDVDLASYLQDTDITKRCSCCGHENTVGKKGKELLEGRGMGIREERKDIRADYVDWVLDPVTNGDVEATSTSTSTSLGSNYTAEPQSGRNGVLHMCFILLVLCTLGVVVRLCTGVLGRVCERQVCESDSSSSSAKYEDYDKNCDHKNGDCADDGDTYERERLEKYGGDDEEGGDGNQDNDEKEKDGGEDADYAGDANYNNKQDYYYSDEEDEDEKDPNPRHQNEVREPIPQDLWPPLRLHALDSKQSGYSTYAPQLARENPTASPLLLLQRDNVLKTQYTPILHQAIEEEEDSPLLLPLSPSSPPTTPIQSPDPSSPSFFISPQSPLPNRHVIDSMEALEAGTAIPIPSLVASRVSGCEQRRGYSSRIMQVLDIGVFSIGVFWRGVVRRVGQWARDDDERWQGEENRGEEGKEGEGEGELVACFAG